MYLLTVYQAYEYVLVLQNIYEFMLGKPLAHVFLVFSVIDGGCSRLDVC